MTTGQRLREIRLKRHKTLEEVAAAIDSTATSVSKYESDKVQNIPKKKILAIAEFLDVSPSYLMGLEEAEEARSLILTINEQLLVEDFRRLSPEYQQILIQLTHQIAEVNDRGDGFVQLTL